MLSKTRLFILAMAVITKGLLFTNSVQAKSGMQTVTLEKEQRMTLVLAKNLQGGEKAQQTYLDGVLTLAESGSLRELVSFPVLRTFTGDNAPEVFALYSWQNKQASSKVRQHPRYKNQLKPLQVQGWKELFVSDVDMQQSASYQFDASKTYTLAVVWLKDPESYDIYYQGTKALREKMGAKVLFKHQPSEYNSLQPGERAPDNLVLIEWQHKDDPLQYPAAAEFQPYQAYINAGIEKLHWYEIGVNMPADY